MFDRFYKLAAVGMLAYALSFFHLPQVPQSDAQNNKSCQLSGIRLTCH